MLGYVSNCVFMVFASPPAGRATELQEWYDVIHGPDALENGSFNALSRWQCVSNPGAPFLALWEGEWRDDADAWGYIRPLAIQLHHDGRIGDIPSSDWAQMTFAGEPAGRAVREPVRTLTMVQSDWYHTAGSRSLAEWAHDVGVDRDDVGGGTWHSKYFYAADAAVERGLYAAFFESREFPGKVAPGWAGFAGEFGPSPTRPYKGLFESRGEGRPVPKPAECYISHWVQIGALP